MQTGQHGFQLLCRGVDVVVDGQLVADGRQGGPQQAVIVERAYQVLHDIALAVVQLQFAHLLQQLVVERLLGAVDHFLALLGLRVATLVHGQLLVVAANALERGVQGVGAVFAFAQAVIVVRSVSAVLLFLRVLTVRIVGKALVGRYFQRRVVVHLGVDALHELRQRQFYEL